MVQFTPVLGLAVESQADKGASDVRVCDWRGWLVWINMRAEFFFRGGAEPEAFRRLVAPMMIQFGSRNTTTDLGG
jgi:hypothetical protein